MQFLQQETENATDFPWRILTGGVGKRPAGASRTSLTTLLRGGRLTSSYLLVVITTAILALSRMLLL